MAIAAGKVTRLRRDHDFVFRERTHIERLVRAGARRENVRARKMQRLEQPFSERSEIDLTRCGYDLQTHIRMNASIRKAASQRTDVTQPSPRAWR